MKQKKLCIYLTAGFPKLDSMFELVRTLDKEDVDYIEIGMPYSDPLADGATIQYTSKIALENGMKLDILFQQLQQLKPEISTPIIYMGYLNPVIQYGVEKFLDACQLSGIQGLILPDLPIELYQTKFMELFREKQIGMNFLVSPSTQDDRIMKADALSDQYLYVISQNTITGTPKEAKKSERQFFSRLQNLPLTSEKLIGFGIKDKAGVEEAFQHADGAIIGSAFLKVIDGAEDLGKATSEFIHSLKVDI
jgi:tryptophan synthase alpha chain